MTQDINLNDTDESTYESPLSDIGDFGPVEVVMPDGTVEVVDPEYDIIVAVNAGEFYDGWDGLLVHRTEIRTDETDHSTIMDAVEYGLDVGFKSPYASEDPMISKAYLRDVFDEKQLCLEIVAPSDDGDLSVIAASIRESCCNRLA